jgi:hypothetical protein
VTKKNVAGTVGASDVMAELEQIFDRKMPASWPAGGRIRT